MTRTHGWKRRAPLVALLALAPLAKAYPTSPAGMVRIPSSSIVLGSSMDEVIRATLECGQASTTCRLEDFTSEISAEQGVRVRSFFLDRFEISQADYQGCVDRARCTRPASHFGGDLLQGKSLPVVFVDWYQATTFCQQRGARLPSEAEFETASRGATRRYPWGQLFHHRLSNAGSQDAPYTSSRDGVELLAPVSAFPQGATPLGVYQLAGNVAEWTSSKESAHGNATKSSAYVVKGGSFSSPPVSHRGAARRFAKPGARLADVGFRCAKDTAPEIRPAESKDQK